MSDYKVKIQVDDREASRKLGDIGKQLKEVTGEKKVTFKLPDFNNLKRDLKEVGQYAGHAATAFKQFTPIGKDIAEIEENLSLVSMSLVDVGRKLAALRVYANPIRGMADTFYTVADSVNAVTINTAKLGFAIFGATQSVNLLKAAFGSAFNDTVGREIQLREQILKTATTLAGTNRLFADGFEIEDPTEKLKALEKPINESIERIRIKSLEIAGTTSEAVISTFNIVASQIGSFGGTLRDAESLAVKFAGALGTLGMSDPMYARQEVQSIMMGYIDQNSILAKTLGISSEDIRKAKQSAGGLVDFLNKKLEVFEAGQAMAAKGFRGITSNIQELQEEMKRAFGASLLDPILKRVEAFYETVSGKEAMQALMRTSRAFGQLIGSSLNAALGSVVNARLFEGIDTEAVAKVAKQLEEAFAKAAAYIQEQITRIGPSIERLVNRIGSALSTLTESFSRLAQILVQLKFDQLNIQLQAFADLALIVTAAAEAYGYYLKTIQDIISTPLGRYVNELVATFKVLDQVGVIGLVKMGAAIRVLFVLVPPLIAKIKTFATAIGSAIKTVAAGIATVIKVVSAAVTGAIARIVTAITAAIVRILELIGGVTAAIQASLMRAVALLASSGPQLAPLAAALRGIATAFGAISTAADAANLKVRQFSVTATASMGQASAAANKAATSFANVGKAAGAGMGALGAKAGGIFAVLAGGVVLATLKFFALMAAITLVFDGLRRLKERADELGRTAEARQAIDLLNNGLRDQAEAAKNAGVELDAVTQKLYDNAVAATNSELTAAVEKYLELQNKIIRLRRTIEEDRGTMSITGGLPQGGKLSALEARAKALREEIARLEEEAKKNKLETSEDSDTELKANKRKDEIELIAKFEKDSRKAVEEELYKYRRQSQDKEIQIWRQAEQLRIDQLDYQNRKLLTGVRDSAKVSLDALLDWLGTKKRGELDLQEKQRRAQLAAADMERAIGKFRSNLENQLVELRKKLGQWELEVLDRRIKGEQLIADIRNGSVVWGSPEGGMAGNTGLKMGSTGISSGPHYDIRKEDGSPITEAEARALLKEGMKAVMTSGYGPRTPPVPGASSFHAGIDLAGSAVSNFELNKGYSMVGWKPNNGGLGNTATVVGPDGTRYLVGHLADPDKNWSFGGVGSPGGGEGSHATRAMEFFRSKGLTTYQAAAFVGGLQQESTPALDPNIKNGPNVEGIAQWKESRRADMIAFGAQGDFQKQLEFIWHELNTKEKAAFDKLKASQNLPEAAQAAAGYERFAGWQTFNQGKEWGNRYKYAQNLMKGRYGSADPSMATTSGSGAAGLAAVGGAPNDNFVKLDIDTGELDTALSNLQKMNEELAKLAAEGAKLESAKSFDRFLETLKGPEKALQNVRGELRLKQKEYAESAKMSAEGDFDLDKLRIAADYNRQLQAITDKNKDTLKSVEKLQMSEEDRKTVLKAIEDQHKKNLEALKETRAEQEKMLQLDDNQRRNQEMALEFRRREKALIMDEVSARTEAAKAALGEDNYQGRRRLDAEATVYREWMERTDNGRKPLDEQGQAELQKLAEQAYTSAEALAAVDEELADFAEKLNLAREIAEGVTGSYKNMVGDVLMGGNIQEAVERMGKEIASRMTGKLLDYAFKPIEEHLEKTLGKAFGVEDAQENNTTALRELTRAVENLQKALQAGAVASPESGQSAAPESGQSAAPTASATTPTTTSQPVALPVISYAETFSKVTDEASNSLDNVSTYFTNLNKDVSDMTTAFTTAASNIASTNYAVDKLNNSTSETPETLDSTSTKLQSFASGLAGLGVAALSFVGGFQQIKEGGTHGVLSGLSSIFGGIGAVAGMGMPGGALSGLANLFRARGGPVGRKMPYVVGEKGPELFVPDDPGYIVPNERVPFQGSGGVPFTKESGSAIPFTLSSADQVAAAKDKEALAALRAPDTLRVEYESQVINSVSYVTADQHEKGMRKAAEQGRSLTMMALENSLRARKRIGLS